MKGVPINFENRRNGKQLVVEIEIPGIDCLYLTSHSGHACAGLCLNKNAVNRIRFVGASWESAVPTICVVEHFYKEAYFCKMITHFQTSVEVSVSPCFHKKEVSGPQKVYWHAYTIKARVRNTAAAHVVINIRFLTLH